MSMIARGIRWCSGLGLLVLVAGCGDDPVPSQAVPVTTTAVTGVVATAAAAAPSLRITDAKGRGVKNVLVRWKVTSGGGTVTNDSVKTASDGSASSGGWKLGPVAGLQTLTASADGVPPVTFTATAAPGPVALLAPVSDAVNPVVNTVVTPAPAVRAVDAFGNTVPNVVVTFAVAQGTGRITGEQATTNDQGIARIGSWTLGTTAGAQMLRASATGATSTTIAVLAIPGPVADLERVTAPALGGPAGAPVSPVPGVRVIDAFGNGIGNVPVTFTPASNSGSVTAGTVLTDPANGTAFVGAWVLGSGAVQSLTATTSALPGKSVAFSASLIETAFNLDVRFIGTPTALVQTAFTSAARRWRQVIVGHVQDEYDPTFNLQSNCDDWLPATVADTIRDVVIFARTTPIDGAGQVLGQAYVCAVNPDNGMPVIGVMEFDEADMPGLIARGTLNDVILHEMGHVLGIGTLWRYQRSLLTGAGSTDPYFAGASARAEFAAMNTVPYSGNPVPVENSGGAGTRDSHWRESILQDELMTGYLTGTSRPLSRLTIGSLRDMGYTVSFATADPYRITAALYQFPFVPRGVELVGDIKTRTAKPFGR